MAKKGSPKKMPAVAEPVAEPVAVSKLMPVRIDLDQKDHDRLRVVAARARMSMAKYAKTLVLQDVRERMKEMGLE